MMYKIYAWHRKRKSILYSLFVVSCLLLLSGCSVLPSNLSAVISPTQATVKPLKPTPTLSPAEITLQREQAKAQSILKGMSQDDKLAQMIMVEYLYTDYTTSGLQQMVAQQHVGGVLYQPDGNNNWDSNTTIASVNAFSAQIHADDITAPLIAIDQEGGVVSKTSLLFGGTPSAEQLAETGYPTQAYNQAKTDVSQLKQLGINVDLAPVVDVGPDTTQYGSRFFSADPNTVATYAGAFLKGLQENGIVGTLKHFPGLGSSNDVDPHNGLPTVTKSLSDLQQSDFLPYQQIIQQDNPAMVMVTDVETQALDQNNPAELSSNVIKYLRKNLGFNGVIITDNITMKGLYNGYDPTPSQVIQSAVQAVEAGDDIVEGPASPDTVNSIITAMKTAIQQGNLSQSQIDQAVMRILLMKIQYGIIK